MLLEVAELAVDLPAPGGLQRVVDRTSFSIAEGESLGWLANPAPARR